MEVVLLWVELRSKDLTLLEHQQIWIDIDYSQSGAWSRTKYHRNEDAQPDDDDDGPRN